MRIPRRALTSAVALATAFVTTAPAEAQSVSVQDRGWIGVSIDVRTSLDQWGRPHSVAIVEEVSADSPAGRAGLQRGDILLSINGQPYEQNFLAVTRAIRAGDPVRLRMARGGQEREVHIVAVDRPTVLAEASGFSFRFEADSMAESMYRAMDSLRVHLLRSDSGVHVVRLRGPDGGGVLLRSIQTRSPSGSTELHVRAGSAFERASDPVGGVAVAPGEVRPPFGFFLFEGRRTDSLQAEMERLNREIREVDTQHRALLERVTSGPPGSTRAVGAGSAEVERLARTRELLAVRSVELRRAMERVAADAVGGRGTATWTSAPEAPGATSFRPLSPYVLGQNRAAGAQVVDLQPELADYFGVSGGVLVVEVADGTPAALAGLQPGDVITRVGGLAVGSIDELRAGLTGAAARTSIEFVRKGRALEVTLAR